MAGRRRPRVRAADLAPARSRKSLTALVGVGIALSLLILYKTHVGDDATQLLEALGVDPSLALPATVSDAGEGQGALAEGSLGVLAEAFGRAAQGCAAPGTVARVKALVAVDPSGRATVAQSTLEPDATAPPGFVECLTRAEAQVAAPLGGPAHLRLMVSAWRPAGR